MYHFFVEPQAIDLAGHRVFISGEDVRHIKNVLRMRAGEEISVSDRETAREYRCLIKELGDEVIECSLCFVKEADTELPTKIYLFQGLPKADKLEMVIQKAVELGAYSIVPVSCHRSVVKLDEKKAAKKQERWQQISEAAAKQSKRALVPVVERPVSFREAMEFAGEKCALKLLPYELSDPSAMEETRKLINSVKAGGSIGIFIGPEGGFEDEEIELAKKMGFEIITLGRRILRTETAGMTVLSWLMLQLEGLEADE